MKKLLILSAVLLIIASFALTACVVGPRNPIVGVWEYRASDDYGATYEFKADGKFIATLVGFDIGPEPTEGTYRINGNKLTIKLSDGTQEEITATFSISGNELTLIFVDNGKPFILTRK